LGVALSEREAKQVIVVRKDLNMRKGKMVAQGSHASLGAVLLIQEAFDNIDEYGRRISEKFHDGRTRPFFEEETLVAARSWLEGQFSKICVSVDDETELMRIYAAAERAKLPVKLITDSGRTEFHGVPTRTCLAIGPCWAEDVDRITGDLKLL
jgi:PTH2 family peptidyl-tRNA hydrolase